MDCDGDGEMRLVGLVVMLVASVAAVVSLSFFCLVSWVSMRSGVPILMKIGHPSLRSEDDSMLSAKKVSLKVHALKQEAGNCLHETSS